jgi:hypothetical protein
MADIGLIRKRLRLETEQARRTAAARRERTKSATIAYEKFVETTAIPTFRQLATVLRAEGIPFEVQTPAGGVRLAPERARDDGITLELDATQDPPAVVLRTTHTWGSQISRRDRTLKAGTAIDAISEDDVLEQLFEEIRPWLG